MAANYQRAVQLASLAALAGAGAAAYILVVKPWHERWGATGEEVRRPIPGDELVAAPRSVSTRAITVLTPPSGVWPWLVQLGKGRGGWYSYEFVEGLMGLDISNADRILPEFQLLQPGDTIPTGGPDIPVVVVDSNRFLVLGGENVATIAFGLYPTREDETRLVMRMRLDFGASPSARLWTALTDLGGFVMSRKMLLTIKDRAERRWATLPEGERPHGDEGLVVSDPSEPPSR